MNEQLMNLVLYCSLGAIAGLITYHVLRWLRNGTIARERAWLMRKLRNLHHD